MKKLNNKGYMLIELIVSAVMAFSLGYYLLNLTYNFADRNENLYLSNIMLSYKALVTKNIMNDLEKLTITEVKSTNNNEVEITTKESETRTIYIDSNSNTIKYKEGNNTIYTKKFKDNIKIEQQEDGKYYKLISKDKLQIITITYSNIYIKDKYNINLLLQTE